MHIQSYTKESRRPITLSVLSYNVGPLALSNGTTFRISVLVSISSHFNFLIFE